MLRLPKYFRSFRLRVAILVTLATGYLAYAYTDGILSVVRNQKQIQFEVEVRSVVYEIANYLHSIGYINLFGDPADLSRKPVREGEADFTGENLIEEIFREERYNDYLGWALLDAAEQFTAGSARPVTDVLPSSYESLEESSGNVSEITEEKEGTTKTGNFLGRDEIVIRHLLGNPKEPGLIVGHVPIGDEFLVVWYDMADLDRSIGRGWYLSARGAIPFALVCGGITWLILTYSLRPIRRITRLSKQFAINRTDRRISIKNEPSEFDELVTVLNEMLDRLDENVRRISEFSDNASHELKTPLTILQGKLELALTQAEDESEEQFRSLELLEEVQKLIQVTETLLLLSRSDRDDLLAKKEPVNLSNIVSDVFELCQQLDEDLTYEQDITQGIRTQGDPQLIQQMVMNLATNAVRHNRSGGYVKVSLSDNGKMIQIRTENSGRQIPEDKVDHIFDRFYRTDPARSRETGGLGLGLNLASEIARAHGGSIVLETNEKDHITFCANVSSIEASREK